MDTCAPCKRTSMDTCAPCTMDTYPLVNAAALTTYPLVNAAAMDTYPLVNTTVLPLLVGSLKRGAIFRKMHYREHCTGSDPVSVVIALVFLPAR